MTSIEHPELNEAIELCRDDSPGSGKTIVACTEIIEALDNSNPLRSSALKNRASVHRWKRDYHAAFAADPSHYNALHTMAYNYFLKGEHQRALDLYARVLEMQPKQFMASYRSGETYMLMDDFESAVEAYSDAIEKNTDSAHSFCLEVMLMRLLVELKKRSMIILKRRR